MSDLEQQQDETEKRKKSSRPGQVTLTQMLKALDKGVATNLEKRLKKLSKKKAIEKPLDEFKELQIKRKSAYEEVKKDISKWDPVVEAHRKAKSLQFPLDQEPDFMPSATESLVGLNPRNELEKEIKESIEANAAADRITKELTKSEEKYLKAISTEEARERHKDIQRTRVLLSTYAAKMRRQNKIKSKSYRRLLKQEKIKKHMKKVETNSDALLDEIERLHKLRAQERASLKHKNTGKWAKHAKFRAKYDEEARKAMLEQIGISEKLRERAAMPLSDSDDEDSEDVVSDVSEDEQSEVDPEEEKGVPSKPEEPIHTETVNDRLIISKEVLNERIANKRKAPEDDSESDDEDDDDDEQRKLMSEAFAGDDIVSDFKKMKSDLVDEEQPKDINLFLPGWGEWAGPGIKINKKKKKKYVIKAKKIDRKDKSLGNVIISEKADEALEDLKVRKLPRGVRNERHLAKILTKPVTSTFVSQSSARDSIQPKIVTRMGARIEPISQKFDGDGDKATWT